jgi:hypothetical protein
LSVLTGIFLVAGRLLKLGFVTGLLSKPIRIGYLNGIALAVIVSQLPRLLGISIDGDTLVEPVASAGSTAAIANGHADRIRGGPLRAPATRMTAARNLRRFRQTTLRVDGYNQITCQALDWGGSHPLEF